ncbi:MAG: tRNA (adenosine(37)-N6)-threonylcarbamoyltransferase complex dimerization subunit type 1 TsaB [Anaerolineae bacterium]|nr:MAG: tRNA (adenosine(37)-N6)-threonylcarbamoyltransferase complex dimerization subunit type 1 TsaB [Anaerolineae bacterium]
MLLALDTSTRYSGIALYEEGRVLLEYTWQSAHFHTRHLAPAVERAFAVTDTTPADLEGIAVATGPGSFTGLRIGLAFAKGLALTRHVPIVGIPTLDFLAAAQPASDLPLWAVLLAGRGRYSACRYHWHAGTWKAQGDLQVWKLPDLAAALNAPARLCGEVDAEARRLLAEAAPQVEILSPAACLRRPAYLAELGWRRLQQGAHDDPATLAPIYLHFQ